MKKNFAKKIALVIAFLLIFVNVFMLSSCTGTVSEIPDGAVDWTLSKDMKTLTNETEGVAYTLYESFPFVFNAVGDVYVYCDTVTWFLNDNYSPSSVVYRPIKYCGVVWIELDGARYYYVTEKGKAMLETLRNGEAGSYHLRRENSEYYQSEEVDKSIISNGDSDLRNGVNVEKINVGLLDNYDAYYIEAFDELGQFSYNYAAVFTQDDNDFLYVNLADIDHQLLNEYGRIHYDGLGEINVTHLNSRNILEMRSCISGEIEYLYTMYEYEIDELYEYENDAAYDVLVVLSSLIFWMSVVFVGFILPLPFLVLGFSLAFIKKLGRPKYWLWVSAFALLWIAFAILFSLIIIVIILI